ncbi:hypothetical protein [Mesorhizobium sp. LNJC403B00]|uniref:hypothetical protein n=1 Tax=Mesorhizobium sp. LNJC403B00 TaxID=1287280 RepID=UPI0004001C61|nr:hypothetical protein [Mesorhizobium sp. LNJC403B00]
MSNQCVTGELPTGAIGISQQHCASIENAAPDFPALRRRFGLAPHDTVIAIREANGERTD